MYTTTQAYAPTCKGRMVSDAGLRVFATGPEFLSTERHRHEHRDAGKEGTGGGGTNKCLVRQLLCL